MKYLVFSLLVVALLLITACGTKEKELPPEPKPILSVDGNNVANVTNSPEAVAEVDKGLQEVDKLTKELNNDELDDSIGDINLSDW